MSGCIIDRPRITLGLKPRITGLPWVVWLSRSEPDSSITIGLTETVDFDRNAVVWFLIDPVVMQMSGEPLGMLALNVETWAILNAALIEDYWNWSVPDSLTAVARVRRI